MCIGWVHSFAVARVIDASGSEVLAKAWGCATNWQAGREA
jgi:hypothetical protein